MVLGPATGIVLWLGLEFSAIPGWELAAVVIAAPICIVGVRR